MKMEDKQISSFSVAETASSSPTLSQTKDSNSNYFARFCFNLGLELKRIEVIADDPDEIDEATQRMAKNYDFVVTSGGIGPTFDDITYESELALFLFSLCITFLLLTLSLPLLRHRQSFQRLPIGIRR